MKRKCITSEKIAKDFADKLTMMASMSMVSMTIALATELKVFQVLASISSKEHPVTAEEVALEGNYKARYIQEILSTLACGDIIEVTECGRMFWIGEEKKCILSHPNSIAPLTLFPQLPIFGKVYNDIKDVCMKDGPLGMQYSSYENFYANMSAFSEALHKKHLKPSIVPLSEMDEKLGSEQKMECLDVGCGDGFHVIELAHLYPNSNFTGVDITKHAIEIAEDKLTHENNKSLKNATFINMNGAQLKEEWTNKFDWITIFDACHDQCRPDLTLKEIQRCLKPDGIFTMVEVKGTSNCYNDKKLNPVGSALLYGISLFHCLPVGNSTKDALGLGAMWGYEKALKMLKEAGFSKVEIVPTPFLPINIMYKCRK
ncbi:Winged helix-turn-helix DNA-binding domain and Methyltransferase domain-containing protein [Strongyloides ratti]|uniref:Winged helix-turn-helix DNA-binding domain and Methyltransferase domain-containing protein n=1 Tax=Strongyloides ratti TaxID=34506 RepID=A0A090KR76_STRRB|nr:Winged helix-turn-helix DNA-binding domain and Methyltransferase domain-containing protein [Strongyloides ratti]CEF59879.2 Winged helix-turn-helix DNA-binding domain and Methyltransferase domain-containing protein [Strongyloides ratti]